MFVATTVIGVVIVLVAAFLLWVTVRHAWRAWEVAGYRVSRAAETPGGASPFPPVRIATEARDLLGSISDQSAGAAPLGTQSSTDQGDEGEAPGTSFHWTEREQTQEQAPPPSLLAAQLLELRLPAPSRRVLLEETAVVDAIDGTSIDLGEVSFRCDCGLVYREASLTWLRAYLQGRCAGCGDTHVLVKQPPAIDSH